MPRKSDSNHHQGATQQISLSEPACVFVHMYRPPVPSNKDFTRLTAFHLHVEIHLYPADGPEPCHWPRFLLVYWLGFSALNAVARPQSLVRN